MRRRRVLPPLFLAALTAAAIFSIGGVQATGRVAGERFLGRLAAAVLELDRWLPVHRQDLEAAARERPRVSIALQGLPIAASAPSAAVLEDGGSELSTAIVSSLGKALYRDGPGAFQSEDSISVRQPAVWTMALLRPRVHAVLEYLALALLVAVVIQASITAITTDGSPLGAVLRPVAAGGGLAAITGGLLWVVWNGCAHLAGPSVNGEIALIARDAAGIVLRDGLAILLGAATALLILRSTADEVRRSRGGRQPPFGSLLS